MVVTTMLLFLAGVLLMTLAGRVHRKGGWAFVALERQDPSQPVGTRWAQRAPERGPSPAIPWDRRR